MFDLLVQEGCQEIAVSSDSPVSQYRNNKNVFLCQQVAKKYSVELSWTFTEAGHGKSVVDGVGGKMTELCKNSILLFYCPVQVC